MSRRPPAPRRTEGTSLRVEAKDDTGKVAAQVVKGSKESNFAPDPDATASVTVGGSIKDWTTLDGFSIEGFASVTMPCKPDHQEVLAAKNYCTARVGEFLKDALREVDGVLRGKR